MSLIQPQPAMVPTTANRVPAFSSIRTPPAKAAGHETLKQCLLKTVAPLRSKSKLLALSASSLLTHPALPGMYHFFNFQNPLHQPLRNFILTFGPEADPLSPNPISASSPGAKHPSRDHLTSAATKRQRTELASASTVPKVGAAAPAGRKAAARKADSAG